MNIHVTEHAYKRYIERSNLRPILAKLAEQAFVQGRNLTEAEYRRFYNSALKTGNSLMNYYRVYDGNVFVFKRSNSNKSFILVTMFNLH